MNYYTVYRAADDTLLASGTSRECQRQLGISSVDSFYCLVSRALSGKNKKYEVLVENMERYYG